MTKLLVRDRWRLIDLHNLTTDDIDLQSIAHSLAGQPRYNGHTDPYYTVAEHAVLVARWLKKAYGYSQELTDREKLELIFTGFHHDDGESIVSDVITPIKRELVRRDVLFERIRGLNPLVSDEEIHEIIDAGTLDLQDVENRFRDVIHAKWKMPPWTKWDLQVHDADMAVYEAESHYFHPWHTPDVPRFNLESLAEDHVPGLPPDQAKTLYLATHRKLKSGRWWLI